MWCQKTLPVLVQKLQAHKYGHCLFFVVCNAAGKLNSNSLRVYAAVCECCYVFKIDITGNGLYGDRMLATPGRLPNVWSDPSRTVSPRRSGEWSKITSHRPEKESGMTSDKRQRSTEQHGERGRLEHSDRSRDRCLFLPEFTAHNGCSNYADAW